MTTKTKTWSELIATVDETFRKWGGPAPWIGNALAARSRTKQHQTPDERCVTIQFTIPTATGVRTIRLAVSRWPVAKDNLAKIASAVEMVRMADAREITDLMVLLYRQMYPAPITPAPVPPGAPTAVHPALAAAYARLYVSPAAPLAVCEAAYRSLIKLAHPDRGGHDDHAIQLNLAIEQIRAAKGT